MTKTTNYQLNQWAKSDRLMMDDFNADNQKIDAALKANADAMPRIVTGSYVGTGAYGQSNANSLTFDFTPKAVLICKQDIYNAGNAYMFLVSGQSRTAQFNSTGGGDCSYCNWSGNTVSWYSTYKAASQLNEDGVSYCYVAWG